MAKVDIRSHTLSLRPTCTSVAWQSATMFLGMSECPVTQWIMTSLLWTWRALPCPVAALALGPGAQSVWSPCTHHWRLTLGRLHVLVASLLLRQSVGGHLQCSWVQHWIHPFVPLQRRCGCSSSGLQLITPFWLPLTHGWYKKHSSTIYRCNNLHFLPSVLPIGPWHSWPRCDLPVL